MKINNTFVLTDYALKRMHARGFSKGAVGAVLQYGRKTHTKGAIYYSFGRRETKKFRHSGIDLRDCEGLHIVCANDRPHSIMTMFRNHDFHRVLCPYSRN